MRPREAASAEEIAQVAYHGPLRGTPSIVEPGNAVLRNTGSWRVERPVINTDLCTRCGLCLVRCPDGAIALDEHGYPVIDYDHCKGCMICRHECPVLAIEQQQETRAW
jgi:2-oxoacid:acceptor oxidoreductase delta subunit (pyruvate/2-ketoisovalerate family)